MASKTIKQELYDGKYNVIHKPNGRPRYKMEGEKKADPNRLSPSNASGIIDKSTPLMIWATRQYRNYMMQNLEGDQFTRKEVEDLIADGIGHWRKARDEAGDIGTLVHDWAEEFAKAKIEGKDNPKLPDYDDFLEVQSGEIIGMTEEKWHEEIEPQVIAGIEGFVDWYKEENVTFKKVEEMVYSETYNYWGRFDVIAEIDGKLYLLDYKTSSGIYLDHRIQTSGYWAAKEEEVGKQFEGSILVHFQKDPEKAKKKGTFAIHKISREEHEDIFFPTFINALNLARVDRAMDTYSYKSFTIDDLELTPYKGLIYKK